MNEEEKKAKEEADAKAKEEDAKAKVDFEASLEGLSDEDKATKIAENEALLKKGTDDGDDIEKALEEEKRKRLEAEDKLDETRRKAKERIEKKKKDGNESDENDKPLTKEELDALMDERDERIRKETYDSRAMEIAKTLSEDPKEAELVVAVWKNRTLQGTIDQQIAEAHAIATAKRRNAQNGELKRALGSGATGDGFNAERKPDSPSEPKINATDKTVLDGYTWDGSKQAYKKIIAGGTKTYYVSKDMKKRWVESIPK